MSLTIFMSEASHLSIFDERKPKRSLTFNQKVFVALGVLCAIPLLFFALFIIALATSEKEREIHGVIIVGSDWLEIRPEKPLEVSHRTQSILLYVADEHESYSGGDPTGMSWAMRFPDGSLVRPEVQLIDEYGNVYELDAPGFLGRDRTSGELGGGMGFSRSFDQSIESNFPRDRVYPIIRMRSPRPIHVSRVVWMCRTGK